MLNNLIGLSSLKRRVRLQIKVCKKTGEIFDHCLLSGIGGTGKTAFARAIGEELGYYFVETHGGVFKSSVQMFDFLIKHTEEARIRGQVFLFFLDEIHGLSTDLQESLYSAMKEWWLPTKHGQLSISPFTLIAATTRFDMLDANSFVTRFPNVWEIDRYSDENICYIIAYEFDKMGIRYNREVLFNISKRCLGIPRNAVTLAKKVRTTVLAFDVLEVTLFHVNLTFDLEGIDSLGLKSINRRYLDTLSHSQKNGQLVPMGIGPLAGKMRLNEDMLKSSVEPILLELGFISPTSRGRLLTDTGLAYLQKT